MTPADELAAAAAKLDALLAEAAADWRLEVDNHLGMANISTPYMIGPPKTGRYEFTGPNDATTEYIAAMRPLVGFALVDWLRSEADRYAKHPPRAQGFLAGDIEGEEIQMDYSVRVARLINGSVL